MARTFGGRPTLGQMTRQPWGGVKPVGGGFDTQAPFSQAPETQGAGWGAPPAVDPWAIQQAVNVGPMSFGGNRATLARLARGGR